MRNSKYSSLATQCLILVASCLACSARQLNEADQRVLLTQIHLEAKQQRLTQLASVVESLTPFKIAKADSVPDRMLFSYAKSIPANVLLKQVCILLSDATWLYNWSNEHETKGNSQVVRLRLWRTKSDPKRRIAEEKENVLTRVG